MGIRPPRLTRGRWADMNLRTTKPAWRLALVMTAALVSACSRDVEPRFEYAWDKVCENVVGVASTDPPSEQFVAVVDTKSLGLRVGQTVRLPVVEGGSARAWVDLYAGQVHRTSACSDIVDAELPPPTVWPAISGTVEVTLSPDPVLPFYPEWQYEVELRFEDLTFRGPHGQLIRPGYRGPIRGTGGWAPG